MAVRVPWRFYDDVAIETYYLPVNPEADSGSYALTKSVRYNVSASNYTDSSGELRIGDVVAQDAPSAQQVFSYSGNVYTKDQYDQFVYWFEKAYPWFLRDDLGREWLVYLETFQLERQMSRQHRWKHKYNFSGIVLEEVSV